MAGFEYDHWKFITSDTLPTVAECIQGITMYAPSFGGAKQKKHIYQFCKHLLEVWRKAFGREVEIEPSSSSNVNVAKVKYIAISELIRQMTNHLKYYATKVQKAKGSKRVNMKNWYAETNQLFNVFAATVDPEKLDDAEHNFYKDQLSRARRMKIDGENIDNEYENNLVEIELNQKLEEEEMADELCDTTTNNIMESTFFDQTDDPQNVNFSINRSGTIRQTISTNEQGTQTPSQSNLRDGSRNLCESIKVALAASSAAANISPHQARVAFQVTSEIFFGVKYVLSPENDSMVESDEPKCKKPRTKEQYSAEYQNVLPSTKTIARMKHLMAIQQERNAALALLDTAADDVVTVHYDTTTRKRLNGEWPSLIVKTSTGKTFRLRSLNMAVEDRQNIVKLFLASLGRLALTVHADKNVLWEKITALMTDSVKKNLKIENLIAASLYSQHIPLHVLCVSHTCEAFDTGNLVVLKHVEEKSDMKNIILKRMPSLRTFLSKGVLPAVITALCKLVSNDGHKSSIYEVFDNVLKNAEKSKKLSIFKERRFALFGYSAAALIHHIDDLKTTIETTASHNKLVQACELYLEIDYIEVALRCIAWFTFKITLPFLNMCELETSKTLLSILPKLHDDLAVCNMDTLETYKVDYSFTVNKPVSPLATHILERFCKQAAIDLARQRGQEYGFVEVEDENRRATDLTKVPDQIVQNLPDHNLFCERDLSHMDKLANRSAACSNRNFSGKGMRDDMTLYQSNITTIEKETKSIAKLMDEEEKLWFESQKEITKRKLVEKQAKGIRSREQSVKLLDKCKTHNGPFTCVEEVKKAVDETKDDKKRKTMLRNEILFRKTICRQDHQDNPALYKVNGLTEAEMKINLGVMLSGDHGKDTDEAIEFPDEEKILSFLEVGNIGDDETNVDDSAATGNAGNEVPLHEPCAVIWDEPNGRNWYIGITKSQVDDDHYMIEYLERDPADLTKGRWRYPNKEEEQCTEAVQIIPCNIIGAWDGRRRKPHFVVDNWEIIEGLFQSLYLS